MTGTPRTPSPSHDPSDGSDEVRAIRRSEAEVVRAFESLPDVVGRYRYLAALGRALPPFPEREKTEESLVPGCSAELWLTARLENGRVRFAVESPSLVVKGVAAILIEVLSDRTPEAIVGADLGFLKTIGLDRQLSASRSNGLATMVARIRAFAAAHTGGTK